MDEEKERQKEVLEDAGLNPDLSACYAQAGEFDEDPPSHEATDGHSEQPACAEASAGREMPRARGVRKNNRANTVIFCDRR